MANPPDIIRNTTLQRVTEGISSVDDNPVVTLDTGGCEKIELVNKGPNTVYFRTDGTTPTSGASGNGDQLTSGQSTIIAGGDIDSVKMICAAGESATVFHRLYS